MSAPAPARAERSAFDGAHSPCGAVCPFLAQQRRTMIDNWDRMLFRRDNKIDRIVKESQ